MGTEPGGGDGNWWDNIVGSIPNPIGGIGDAIGFWSDPFGNMYKAAREAVDGLANDFLPAITGATLPDLSTPAFIDTYRVSFAISFFVAMILLATQLVRTAQGTQSGRETLESIGMYFPGFILGTMFGPLAGMLIVNFVRGLTDSLLAWAYQGTAEQFAGQLTGTLLEDPAAFAGGVYIAWMVAWAMAIGLLVIVIFFVVQLVTLYFSGALIPLAWVSFIDPRRRPKAIGAAGFWVGLLLTHPFLVLMLGLAFRMITNVGQAWGNDGWKNLVTLLIAVLAMYAAAFSPLFLLKYVKTVTEGVPGKDGAQSSAPIGPNSPSRMPQNQQPAPSRPAPTQSAPQPIRGSSAPSGQTLSQAAAARGGNAAAQGSGRVVTAPAAGAQRAGMGAAGGAATVAATTVAAGARKTYKDAERAADTSVVAPQGDSYGKDRP